MNPEITIEARNIGVSFKVDVGQIEAAHDVSFTLHKVQTIALVGKSGSGKSVTARAIMKLLSKRATVSAQAEINYGSKNMARLSDREAHGSRGNRLMMIFQEPMSSLIPFYTIGAQLTEVQIPDPEARTRQYRYQLSGGQRQRVMIAMALATVIGCPHGHGCKRAKQAKMSFKIAIIGAGSVGFTKKLCSDILKVPEFAGINIVLTDINPHNLEIVEKIISRIVKVNHLATRITATTDLREALKDARYIMNVVRLGGLEAFADDIHTR